MSESTFSWSFWLFSSNWLSISKWTFRFNFNILSMVHCSFLFHRIKKMNEGIWSSKNLLYIISSSTPTKLLVSSKTRSCLSYPITENSLSEDKSNLFLSNSYRFLNPRNLLCENDSLEIKKPILWWKTKNGPSDSSVFDRYFWRPPIMLIFVWGPVVFCMEITLFRPRPFLGAAPNGMSWSSISYRLVALGVQHKAFPILKILLITI